MRPSPTTPSTDATFTIEPPSPRASMSRAASRARMKGAVRFTSSTSAKRSSGSSSAGPGSDSPALLTSTSTRPYADSASAMGRSSSSRRPRSHTTTRASDSSAASASRRARRRATITPGAPAASRARQKRAPSPALAPVTTATLPSSRNCASGSTGATVPTGMVRRSPPAGGEMQLDDRGYRRYWDEERETMDPREREKLVLERIKHQLRYVYAELPFYRRHYDAHGFKPDQVRTLEDFTTKVPVIKKRMLVEDQRENPVFGSYAGIKDTEEIARIHGSSGTSGTPTMYSVSRKDWERSR